MGSRCGSVAPCSRVGGTRVDTRQRTVTVCGVYSVTECHHDRVFVEYQEISICVLNVNCKWVACLFRRVQ
jgi:hypothetical protein